MSKDHSTRFENNTDDKIKNIIFILLTSFNILFSFFVILSFFNKMIKKEMNGIKPSNPFSTYCVAYSV